MKSDRFGFESDEFYPVPAAAVDAEPSQAVRELLFRVARLEQNLDEERLQAETDMRELLLQIILLKDDVTTSLERFGVATNAREASILGTISALGRKILAVMGHFQVEAVETIGKVYDEQTSDIVSTEARADVPNAAVLRETVMGYRWAGGLLRRAKVVVSKQPPPPAQLVLGEDDQPDAEATDAADVCEEKTHE